MIAFFSMLLYADGKSTYENKCAICHESYIPMGLLKENFVEYNNTKLQLKAPTLNQLSFRLKQKIGDPSGDEEIHRMEVAEFIKAYVYYPDKQKSVCMDEVLAVFKTMPSMKGEISEEALEAVSSYIYGFDKESLKKHTPRYIDFAQAMKRAKSEKKLIMIKATSPFCHYCKKMDREVLANDKVRKRLEANFIAVEVDVYKEKLPLRLSFKVTPTYFFLDATGNLIKSVPGAWDTEDFITILNEVKNLKKGGKK